MPRRVRSSSRAEIKAFQTREPKELDWASVGAEVVIESHGSSQDGREAVRCTSITAPRRSSSPLRARGRGRHHRHGRPTRIDL